jgi:hypothetical protein
MDRSAVFIVPMMSRFAGTPNSSPEYGSVTWISLAAPNRLSGSINVINSPKPSQTNRVQREAGTQTPLSSAADLRDVPPVDLVNHQRVTARWVLLRPPTADRQLVNQCRQPYNLPMVKALVEQIEEVARWKHRPSAQVIAEALEAGVAQLYAQTVLGEFIRRRISRKEAVKRVGAAPVRLAERQLQAVREDLRWGRRG